uniref:Uncharacterized protein n=1 Tax=Romanomermis culicivorax TaxID=13658 RepID=A0A915I563_ROMCU
PSWDLLLIYFIKTLCDQINGPVGEISPPPEPFMSRPTKMKMQRMMTTMPKTLVILKQANHPPLE